MAHQATARTLPLDLIVHIPSARVGANRLLQHGYSIERIEIDRDGAHCQVALHQTGLRAMPDFKPLSDALNWLFEHGYTALHAEWVGPKKNPCIHIAAPFGSAELDAAVVASEHQLGGNTRLTWCAVRFGCEIRWEETV